MYIYIYIERERDVHTDKSTYIRMCIYIYIYIERERHVYVICLYTNVILS